MVRIFEVKDLAARKRALVVQIDINRETLKLQVATARLVVADLKAKFIAIDLSAFALKTISDVIGLFAPQRRAEGSKPGFFSRIMSGIRFVNDLRGMFRRTKNHADGAE